MLSTIIFCLIWNTSWKDFFNEYTRLFAYFNQKCFQLSFYFYNHNEASILVFVLWMQNPFFELNLPNSVVINWEQFFIHFCAFSRVYMLSNVRSSLCVPYSIFERCANGVWSPNKCDLIGLSGGLVELLPNEPVNLFNINRVPT